MKRDAKRLISVMLAFVILAFQLNAGVLASDASSLSAKNATENTDGPAVYSQPRTEFDNFTRRSSVLLTPIPGSGCIVDDVNGFIYGLAPAIASLEGYVNVSPGYELNYVLTHNGFGTGTVANVVAEGIIVESYTIIIFGDLNGDGNIDGADAAVAVDNENFKINWDPLTDAAYIKAADINGDGNIDGLDAGIAVDAENYIISINQTVGLPYTSRIVFDTAGGTSIPDLFGDAGDAVITPADPVKIGYTFVGWQPTLPAEFPLGFSAVSAQWAIKQCTITFDSVGGTTVAGITQNYNTQVSVPTAPTKTGHSFDGWYSDSDLTTAVSWPYTLNTANVTFYAKWTVNNYSITFDANGGTGGTGPISMAYGTTLTAPTVTRQGYTFGDWSPSVPGTVPAENAVYTAQWSINAYKISFDSAGGTAVADIVQDYGTIVTAPDVPIKTGYTFTGWEPSVPQAMPAENVKCIAQWTINQYTVSFNSNGGTAVADIAQNYRTQVLAPLAPTKTGHTFGGWYTNAELTAPVSWPYTLGAANVNFYAKWTVNNYNITFDANGGTGGTGPISMAYGATLIAPTVTRVGYTFSSWSPLVPGTVPAENAVYTAQWTVNEYKISFDSTGGTTVADIAQDYGTVVTAPDAPTKTGYTFTGWVPSVPQAMPAENMECVAQWSINQYTVSFSSNGGTEVVDITQNYNTQVSAPSAPTKTGHTFSGWYADAGLTASVSWPYTLGAADVTFYAKWTVNNYSITFDANGGTGGWGPTSMAYGAPLIAPTVTRVGYTFDSWSPIPPSTVPVGGGSYTAQWTANTNTSYIVEHYQQNIAKDAYVLVDTDNKTGTTDTSGTSTAKSYAGFTYDVNVLGTVASGNIAGEGTLVLKLYYIRNSYTVTFDANNGTTPTPATKSVIYGDAYGTLATSSRSGYTFNGWYTAATGGTKVETTTTAATTSAHTLYAQWTANTYAIIYNGNGNTEGTVPSNSSHTYDASANAIRTNSGDLAKTGYAFGGWNTAVDGTGTDYAAGATNAGNLSTGADVTLYAKWSINQYTISFDSDGGSSVPSIKQDYGTAVTPPPNPTKTGYTFTGWVDSIPQAMPAENMECVAQWTINQYTVSFNSNGGTAVADITQNYNTQVTAPLAPTKTGHTFDGWYSNATLTTAVSWPYTLGAANVTFYAKWTVNNYNITFAANGGTGGTGPTSMAYGATLTAPTVTREGYTFSSWSPSVPATVPAGDTTYTAQWSINAYKISFDSVGGTAVADITQDYGTSVTAPTDPTKTGYTFAGWQPAVPATMPAEGLTCIASWNINYYPITFDANGGIGGQIPSVAYGVEPTAPGVTKLGYAFDGWLPAIATVTGATTYTAQWVPYSYIIGDIVQFGSYPQSKVTDALLITALNNETLNPDNTVDYDGFKYKREYFTEYLATDGGMTEDPYSSLQDDNGYFIDTVYWFKYEPIQWRVLSNTDGELLVVADKILTSKEYFDQPYMDVTWETCGLRGWLNDDFFNAAFDSNIQAKIATSMVDNPDNFDYETIGGNATNDKLFLLSYEEAAESSYGFNPNFSNPDVTREAVGTDYAKCKGLYVDNSSENGGNSRWWLRSPGHSQDQASYIDADGYGGRAEPAVNTYIGVRPTLRIDVDQ